MKNTAIKSTFTIYLNKEKLLKETFDPGKNRWVKQTALNLVRKQQPALPAIFFELLKNTSGEAQRSHLTNTCVDDPNIEGNDMQK